MCGREVAVWREGDKGGWCGRDIAGIHSLRGGRISHDQLYFTIGYNLLRFANRGQILPHGYLICTWIVRAN